MKDDLYELYNEHVHLNEPLPSQQSRERSHHHIHIQATEKVKNAHLHLSNDVLYKKFKSITKYGHSKSEMDKCLNKESEEECDGFDILK